MRDKTPQFKINNNKLARNVLKAQNGDKKALEYIVSETGNYVYYYCLSMLCNEEKAKDAVQDIYVKVLSNLRSVEYPKAFLGWIKTVTANYCRNILADKRENEELTDKFEENDIQIIPEKCVETEEVCEILRNAVSKLPEIQRECVLMYYYQQLSVKEISSVLEVKEGTVKSRLYTARKAIKNELEKYGKANLLGGAAPLSYISYTLINDAEKSKFTISEKSVFALKTQVEKGIVTASKAAVNAVKYAALVKTVAVSSAFVVAAGGITYFLTQNTKNNHTVAVKHTTANKASETIQKIDALKMFYSNGFYDKDKRKEVSFNPDKDLNSKSNKMYILDRIYNSLDYFKTIQSTFYLYDISSGLEEGEYVTYCADTDKHRAKEIIFDSNGTPFSYTLLKNEMHYNCDFGDRADNKKSKGDKKILAKAQKQRYKTLLLKLYENEFVQITKFGREHQKLDFVKFIDPMRRYKYDKDAEEYVQYSRCDIFNLYSAPSQYKSEMFAISHKMTYIDNWTVEKIVYKFDRECFFIKGTSNGFNHIYNYKALVDKENGIFLSLDAYGKNGELIRRIQPYEYRINEDIDNSVFDKNTDKIKQLPYGGLNDIKKEN